MRAALALASRGRGRTAPNPSVGCLIVSNGHVVGRGWTQPSGRPHAEAVALDEAGGQARDATVFVTLEPCAHESARGPACADLLVAARPERVVVALEDADERTAGNGIERLRKAGIKVEVGVEADRARKEHAGFLVRMMTCRPRVALKLAMSIDGRVALESGESQWITGDIARAHAHLMRAESDMILVGRGTLAADDPSLTVRLPGLEDRSPRPTVMSATLDAIPDAANMAKNAPLLLNGPEALQGLPANDVLVEGGAGLASSLLRADVVDRLLVYRAPVLLGDPAPGAGRLGLERLGDAHDRWRLSETRFLGSDRLETYERTR
ncbi:MAG: bifunctional diaminohydroxyphosphoribosylaminopyrimidine deaminase/5-amino-6-(5-phosphoribosylamino)uracil reductase RibD [Pacificimonas sp.]